MAVLYLQTGVGQQIRYLVVRNVGGYEVAEPVA